MQAQMRLRRYPLGSTIEQLGELSVAVARERQAVHQLLAAVRQSHHLAAESPDAPPNLESNDESTPPFASVAS